MPRAQSCKSSRGKLQRVGIGPDPKGEQYRGIHIDGRRIFRIVYNFHYVLFVHLGRQHQIPAGPPTLYTDSVVVYNNVVTVVFGACIVGISDPYGKRRRCRATTVCHMLVSRVMSLHAWIRRGGNRRQRSMLLSGSLTIVSPCVVSRMKVLRGYSLIVQIYDRFLNILYLLLLCCSKSWQLSLCGIAH